jgi:N-acetylmuramoyl-L-alanine amidase
MHWATRCCETHPWRLGTFAAALLVLGVPAARAGETNAAATAPQYAAACTRAASFHAIVDVGHGTKAPGALSARGVDEYDFNLRLAREIDKQLHAAGFAKTVLLVTPDKPPRGLFRRVAYANGLKADLFLAVHHDSVPDKMLETWQVDGRDQHYNDRFPGHSLFISNANADRAGSLAFARQLGLALKAHGLQYTPHYTEKFMGNRRRELVDPQAGVYRYDQLVVLKRTLMPAALLEAGSIVNRNEELLLATPEHEAIMAGAVVEAVDAFCTARAKPSGEPVVAKKLEKSDKHEPVVAAKTPEKQKPDKKADGVPRQRAAAESGTWSFLRNFRLLSSAHARNRESAEK